MTEIIYLQQQKLQTFLSQASQETQQIRSTIVEITNISQPIYLLGRRRGSTIVEITNISQPSIHSCLVIKSTIVEITNISQPCGGTTAVAANLQQQKLQTFLSHKSYASGISSTIVEITNISQPLICILTTHKSTIVEITNISQPSCQTQGETLIYNSRNYKHFLASKKKLKTHKIYNSRNYKHFLASIACCTSSSDLQQQKLQTFLSLPRPPRGDTRSTIVEITNISQPLRQSARFAQDLQQQKLQTFLSLRGQKPRHILSTIVEITNISQPFY